MDAIILTPIQAAQLRAARTRSDTRVLEARQLEDGRYILNADILDDPYFSDPSHRWAAIIAGQTVIIEEPKAGQADEVESAREAIANSLEQVRSQVISLSAAELIDR